METPTAAESLLLEDFGQKVDLTRRIREVLINYPEGTTVLKELIQNADDAGATKVCLCLDRRAHGTDSLLSEKLAPWQGPALLAYNNAEFTEDDFVSISRIGGSTKHGQAWKTGRFGVGFNSVYHLTDLPSFVSGKYVVIFDPQGVYLPNVSAANPGKRIEYVNSSAISLYKDQFFPYCAFGCDMKSPFPGTLFRFPLRNEDQAANSNLSKQAYLEDDISSMFVQLYEEGVFSLLFLKSILSIEMYVWDVGMSGPKKIFSCSINSVNNDVVWHRQALLRLSKSTISSEREMDAFSLEFLSEALTGDRSEQKIDTFHIVQTMASASSRIGSFATAASRDYDIHLLPWASVAACVSDNSLSNDILKVGRAFCFLPLPVKTGINVQVNGFFEVSSNRRGIWYGADMDRAGRIRSLWNRLLLEDVLAPSFTQLLLNVQQLLGPTELYYSLWPTGSFEEPWNILVEHVYRCLGDYPVLHSDLGGGRWVSPEEAYLHDEEFCKSKELGEALVQLGMPVVHLRSALGHMLLQYASTYQQKVVTPDSIRHFLRECKSITTLERAYKLILLEYCLDDLLDSDVGGQACNIPLLPLANGEFGLLSETSKGFSYFICNELEYMLFQQISNRLLDRNIPPNILDRLSAIAKASRTNLTIFKVDNFLLLLPQVLPADWKCKAKVVWDPSGNSNHPTSSWFVLFWQYLQDHCKQLALFSDWPIFPSLSGHLYRPSMESKLLNAEKLSERLRDILVKVGCKILDGSLGVKHPDLIHFVCDADSAGVLESIFDVVSSSDSISHAFLHCLETEERDVLRQFLLDPKWYIGNHMDEFHIQNCKRLPIFRVYGGESAENFQYFDLNSPKKYLPPLECPTFCLSCEFICSSSNAETEVLRRYYGVQRMGKAYFFKQYLIGRIQELEPHNRDTIMLSVLHELPQLCAEDPSFRDCLRNLEFVPISSGSLKCPAVLYDPRNEELYALLEDSDCFPSGVFQESGTLDMLQSLGLRTAVSPEAVILSARQVEKLMHNDQQRAHIRGKVLLSYLEVNALKWAHNVSKDDQGAINRVFSRAASALRARNLRSDLEKFWNDLRMICWCPVLVSSPFESLPWPAVSTMVAPPKLVRLYADLWLVSASMRILDGECSSTALSYYLGWSSPPGGSVIAAQLLELGKNNEIMTDLVLRQELALAMPRIYAILTDMIGSDEMDIVKAVLEGCRWIWVGDGFATADEVVLNGPLHLAPYIRVIPVDLAVFRDLFLELGIREFLNSSDYANILTRMSMKKASIPLDTEEVRAAILIAQHLAEVQFYDEQIKIYLPDVLCRLINASDLVYNDAPWLLDSEEFDGSFGNASNVAINAKRTVQKFVHGNISNDVAEKLGVRSLRRMLLAESADSMNLSLSGAAEAFGQHEALTTRLKHILEMYADGPGILFELVQNAEDARASEVIFMLDKTQYGTSSILSPEMADWQGPALYCYNDSVFSPQDLYAISRIGQESKLEKPFAIGRFGLGFNCVYHFTDIPTFVSGENIVMFDPHACNLPGISPSHPGLRIKFTGRRILEQFPDQFSPFLHFGCDLQNSFPGTLFRFPLRSASVASRSQIKKEVYAPDDVISLFSNFSQVVSETLLFLRNVKAISIFVKEGSNCQMQLLHRVCKQFTSEPEIETNLSHQVFSLMHGHKQDGINMDQLLNKLNRTTDTDLPWQCQKVVVMEESSSGNTSHLWLTSECLANGGVKSNSTSFDTKSHKFIPWACVASHLRSVEVDRQMCNDSNLEESSALVSDLQVPVISVEAQKSFEGRAFCFLPLPINTGLPVHVNAYFELSSNRRDIWFGNDMAGGGKKRSEWNTYLLENIAAPAYGHLLEKIALEIGPCDLFFSFWPTKAGLEPWAGMVQKFYHFIADSGLNLFYTKARGGQWVSTKQSIFPDFAFDKSDELVEALSDSGLPVVTVPKPLVDKLLAACPSLHFLTPQLLRRLLIRRKRGFKDRNAMLLTLEYCLLDLRPPIESNSYYGLPLIPLSNGSFTTFEKRGLGERIYVAQGDEYGLLMDSVPFQLVDSNISDVLHCKLCDIALTEDFNLSFLTCHLLEKLFLRLLPAEWQHSKQVTWVPGHQGHPSLEWMRLLWSYLKLCCEDLSLFSKWPILPVGNNHLLQLVENSNVIKDDGWSENMSSLLLRIGCLILRRDFLIEHAQLEKYVQSPTACGILSAILVVAGEQENIEELFCDTSMGEMHEFRSFILQSKWFSEDALDCKYIDMIKCIPMFESFKSRKLVCLSKPTKWFKPDGVPEDLLDDDFVRVESDKERFILNKYLNIRELSRLEFYKSYVLNRMPEFLSQRGSLSAILHDMRLLVKEDNSIRTVLSTTPFVLARNGSWQEPSRLYDPRVPELQTVLHREAFFPSEEFSDPETLEILVDLGLRKTYGFTGLLDSARSISMLYDSGDSEAIMYGRRLLGYLDLVASKLMTVEGVEENINDSRTLCQDVHIANDQEEKDTTDGYVSSLKEGVDIISLMDNLFDDKPEEEFWSELKAISWCPVLADPPISGLPWLASGHKIVAPGLVRPKEQMWMVSSKLHVLDGESCSTYLQKKLGWMDRIEIDILSMQLIGLSKSYTLMKLDSKVAPDFHAALQDNIPLLYYKLQEYVGTENFLVLKSDLAGVNWVWIGDDFVAPNALAFDSPVKFTPYLYVVPSELSAFRDLLLALDVRLSFDDVDYFHVVQCLQSDVRGSPLTIDQLNFVHCVLEAIAESHSDRLILEASNTPLLVPDSCGILRRSRDLVYNDAPWIENNALVGKHFLHPLISQDLANKLGIQSLRSISLVSEEMTKDLPCMDHARICELLALYGDKNFLLFDLLELADCCKAKRLHLILDLREHPRQYLLQHNLGEFQGPALLAILEGTCLTREELASLQFLPPWSLRNDTLNYGLGLLSCYSITDLLSVVSGGYFYMFDPQGVALAAPSSRAPAAKMFPLTGTNLTDLFPDQFNPMLLGQDMPWSLSDSTVIRMPLSSECMKDGTESGAKRVTMIFETFIEHASRMLLFLKSVFQVSLSTWEERSPVPCQDFSVHVDPSEAVLRNPFSEKRWKKFQLSSLFSASNAATKFHVINVNLYKGGSRVVDRWLLVLSLGSGQTRNMALDRRYLAYNLTPVAGVAAHVSRNGHPAATDILSSIMSPLPLSTYVKIPVTIVGCFLVRQNQGRYLFKYQDANALAEAQLDAGNQLIEAWNRELMACVRDSYIKLILEMQKLRREPSTSALDARAGCVVSMALNSYGDHNYSFWPRSHWHAENTQTGDSSKLVSPNVLRADWECLVEQVIKPFYVHLVDFPVWQLYSGNVVKADEGMFLSQPGTAVGDSLLPATVCAFVKEHYPVFSVPWELVTELHAVGAAVREIKPKMVRDLLRVSSASIVLRSVDTYLDVLEYCLSDIQFADSSISALLNTSMGISVSSGVEARKEEGTSSASISSDLNLQRLNRISNQSPSGSGGDALEMMTSLGKALFDFGRGVVEDIGRGGVPLNQRNIVSSGHGIIRNEDTKLLSIAAELKGIPCPTATNHLTRLGFTELWVGSKEQQMLMNTLAEKFIHPKVLERLVLAYIFLNCDLQPLLKLQNFSLRMLSNHMRLLFHDYWVNHVMESTMAPWFSWASAANSGGEGGPSPEWIRLFWKTLEGSLEDLSLFSDWPLIPAFLGRPVLCRVRARRLVFIPPPLTDLNSVGADVQLFVMDSNAAPLSEMVLPYAQAFKVAEKKYPWLLTLLNQCNVPFFDTAFMECAAACSCFPPTNQTLGQVILSKLVAAKQAGYFPELTSFLASDRDELFTLFASDFSSNGSAYGGEEFEVLRDLPIYKTVAGTHMRLHGSDLCMISSNTFLKPHDQHCLCYTTDSVESSLIRALGVPELHDQQILVKFGLPGFEGKPHSEQEDILIYLCTNWQDIQHDSSIVEAVKETKFVRNADELSVDLSKPKDLFDPGDALLTSIFSAEGAKFPGERFITDGWLHILRKTGLRTSTEADVVFECARRIEFLGNECMNPSRSFDDFETDMFNPQNEVPLEIWSLAESLVKSIFSNFAVLYGNSFCNLLGKIAFVPAEKGFPNVGGKNGGRRVLCSYSEAILLKDWPLAWSYAPVLSKQSVVPPEYSWGALHLRSPPAFTSVLEHLKVIGRNSGEDTLAHWPTASGLLTIDGASIEILKYLDKIWNSLSSSDIAELRQLAFIPAANGTRLVTVSSLFARLTINLSPFAFELPAQYLPFAKILKVLGLQDTLSVHYAKDLLSSHQKACGYQRLNPNELRSVMEILHFLCDRNTEANTSDRSNWVSDAIVPDDGCRLVHAKSCIYIDPYGSLYINYIDTSRLRFVHQDLPESICVALGIKKLSDVVVEELDLGEQLQNLEQIGSIPLAVIRQKLLNKSFQAAVWSVASNVVSDIPAFDCPSQGDVESLLASLADKLQFVKCIYTHFWFLSKSLDITRVAKETIIPDWKEGSRHRALYFVDRAKTIVLIAEPPTYISVPDVVAIVVSQVLGFPLPLPIGSLFLCPEDSETALVGVLKLCSKKKVTEWTTMRNGFLGREILPQDAVQVQFHPLRPFYTGEIVAWRSQIGEKLKYGRVPEDVRPPAGQALYRFRVEISPGVIEHLLSSHVFSFRSMSIANEGSSRTMLEDDRAISGNKIVESEGFGSFKLKPSQQPPAKELQHGRVSPAELVHAVHEMLSAAGVNLDVEKQSLLQTTLTLQEHLKESQAALLIEQEKSDLAAKEADTAKAAWLCRVCLSNEVDMTMVPCGHVLCRRCSSAVSRCPFCRLQVSKTMRIFRP